MRLELKPLIELLQSVENLGELKEQMAAIELALVCMELNPNPVPLFDTLRGIEALAAAENLERTWLEMGGELEPFFRPANRTE